MNSLNTKAYSDGSKIVQRLVESFCTIKLIVVSQNSRLPKVRRLSLISDLKLPKIAMVMVSINIPMFSLSDLIFGHFLYFFAFYDSILIVILLLMSSHMLPRCWELLYFKIKSDINITKNVVPANRHCIAS